MNMLKEVPSKPRGAKVAMFVLSLMILAITPGAASADVSGETAYVLNTLSFLMHGFLVLWMAAGFAMLEAGLVRTKSVTTILLKNVALFSTT
jgi:Amt family ammonium transporter